MLTGDDGVPKVLPSLCLLCSEWAACLRGYSWLGGSLPFCGGELMFFPWLLPLEGWHSMATSAQPMLRLTQGGDVAFSIWSLSALVRQSDVKEWVPPNPPLSIPHPTLFSIFLSLTLLCVDSSFLSPFLILFLLVLSPLHSPNQYIQCLFLFWIDKQWNANMIHHISC